MRNGTKHKMMPLLSPFTTYVLSRFFLPDEMADVSIAGLQWFIRTPRLNYTGLTGQLIVIPNPYLHQENKI